MPTFEAGGEAYVVVDEVEMHPFTTQEIYIATNPGTESTNETGEDRIVIQ